MSAETNSQPNTPGPASPMKMNIVRNELRWAVPLGLLGLFIHVAAQISEGGSGAWIRFDDDWIKVSASFYVFATPVLALVAALLDELTGTREYLVHRPVSPARIFWTRQAVVAGVLIAWIVLTPLLHLAFCHVLDRDSTALIEYGLYSHRLAQGLPAFLIYAVTVFALSSARTLWGAALLALAALTVTGSLVAVSLLMPRSTLLVQAASVVGTPLLLLAALRNSRQGRDSDRPWGLRRLGLSGPVLLLVTGIIGAASLTAAHFAGINWLYELYPDVAKDGERYVLRKWDGEAERYRQVDGQHRHVDQLLGEEAPSVFSVGNGPWERLERDYQGSDEFPGAGHWAGGKMVVQGNAGRHRRGYYVSDGYVYIYVQSKRGEDGRSRASVRKLGKAPDGRPFSPRAAIVSDWHDPRAKIHDPEDGQLWAADLSRDQPAFVPQALPGGDRFVSMDSVLRLVPVIRFPTSFPTIINGERGQYLLDDGEWKPVPPELAREQRRNPRLERDVDFAAGGRVVVTLERPGVGQVFHHRFQPHTFWERTAQVMVEAPTLLRAPVTTVGSLWREQRSAYRAGATLLLDPAVTMGSRATVAGNLAVCLILAGLCFLRLRRLGVRGGRRTFWTGAVVLGGLPAYLCYRLVETDRAWKPAAVSVPAKTAPARLLLTA